MKFEFDGYSYFHDVTDIFKTMEEKTANCCKIGLYDGANIIANEVRAECNARGWNIAAGLTLSTMRTDKDSANIWVGFGGYDEKGSAYPAIANTLESGNSKTGTTGTHFFSQALNRCSNAAIKKMEESFYDAAQPLFDLLEGD